VNAVRASMRKRIPLISTTVEVASVETIFVATPFG